MSFSGCLGREGSLNLAGRPITQTLEKHNYTFLSVYFQRYDGMVKFYSALPDVMYVCPTPVRVELTRLSQRIYMGGG